MFKKILFLFSILTVFAIDTGTAIAINPDKCFIEFDPDKPSPTTADYGIIADFIIYFDNNVGTAFPTTAEGNCRDKIIDAFNARFADPENIESVLIFGSADATGPTARNIELSQQRANLVYNLIKDTNENIPACSGTHTKTRCANISMGDAVQRASGKSGATIDTRGVYVFILDKRDLCDESTQNILTTLKNSIPADSTDIQTSLDGAITLCKNNKNEMFRSERQTIMNTINEALGVYKGDKSALCNLIIDATFNKETGECVCEEGKFPDANRLRCIDLPKPTGANISTLVTGFNAMRTALARSASEWKNTEGKFNTARLISDSVAGVVLGTAGGLITSSIVKKNQLNTGLKNIMCTVGGQSVATYGDEFSVGITTK